MSFISYQATKLSKKNIISLTKSSLKMIVLYNKHHLIRNDLTFNKTKIFFAKFSPKRTQIRTTYLRQR